MSDVDLKPHWLRQDGKTECRVTFERVGATDGLCFACSAPVRPQLCRTCMRPITWETRTEPGFKPREGWYDDCRTDPGVCFRARDYQHVPLTDRERAYFEAGRFEMLDEQAITIYDEVRAERERAHAKHGENSMEGLNPFDYRRLSILLEEVGEVAMELNDAQLEGSYFGPERRASLRAELIQVAAMAAAWADSLGVGDA